MSLTRVQDTDSQISSGSKPNSNGYNVRFGPDTKPDPSEVAEQKQLQMAQMMQQMMHDQVNPTLPNVVTPNTTTTTKGQPYIHIQTNN